MKSNVYAFGVVLFEIVSGREAVIGTEAVETKNPEKRPLSSIVSSWSLHNTEPLHFFDATYIPKAFFVVVVDDIGSKELTRLYEHVEFEGVCRSQHDGFIPACMTVCSR